MPLIELTARELLLCEPTPDLQATLIKMAKERRARMIRQANVLVHKRVEKRRAIEQAKKNEQIERAIQDYLSKDKLSDMGGAPKAKRIIRHITCAEIIGIVCSVYGVTVSHMKSAQRTQRIIMPRHEAIWLCCLYTRKSLPEIGRAFGGRDHSTTLNAKRKIQALVDAGQYTPLAQPLVEQKVREIELNFSGVEG